VPAIDAPLPLLMTARSVAIQTGVNAQLANAQRGLVKAASISLMRQRAESRLASRVKDRSVEAVTPVLASRRPGSNARAPNDATDADVFFVVSSWLSADVA
jgi:hypothetical protein